MVASFETQDQDKTCSELKRILEHGLVTAHFQPIFYTNTLDVFGWEALLRAPASATLATPQALFRAARCCNQLLELDLAARQAAIRAFAAATIPHKESYKLFLNIDPFILAHHPKGLTAQMLAEAQLSPTQVVIEITEISTELDYDLLTQAARHYREQGFLIAVDDLGEGSSTLRLWSDVRPDFVKIDRHFVQQASQLLEVRRFLEAIISLADATGAKLVAEGIETAAQLEQISQLGVRFVQGFLLAHPAPEPLVELDKAKRHLLTPQHDEQGRRSFSLDRRTVEVLIEPIEPMSVQDDNEAVFARFTRNPRLYAIPVLDEHHKPLGLILRHDFLEDFARPYRHELFGRKSCRHYVREVLTVTDNTTLHDLSCRFQTLDPEQMGHPFMITTREGHYLGIASGQSLLRELVSLQLKTARYANPLTGLPGNVPINETIDRYLSRNIPFVACYIDISNFKAYNDCYGFVKGDEMIVLVANLLTRHIQHPDDFIGHIGGDDFIVLWGDPEWEKRVEAIFEAYAAAIPDFYTPEDWARGGIEAEDRQGNRLLHPISALTAGALPVAPGHYTTHQEVGSAASVAKKLAKQKSKALAAEGVKPANALFIERRRPGGSSAAAPQSAP